MTHLPHGPKVPFFHFRYQLLLTKIFEESWHIIYSTKKQVYKDIVYAKKSERTHTSTT